MLATPERVVRDAEALPNRPTHGFPTRVHTLVPNAPSHTANRARLVDVVHRTVNKTQPIMPSTQLVNCGTVDDEEKILVPYGRSHYTFNQLPVSEGGSVVSFARKPLDVSNRTLYEMTTTTKKDALLKLWDGKVVPNNVLRLKGKEGEYIHVIFNVEGHPERSKNAFSVPLEIAETVMTKAYEDACNNPKKYNLRLDAPDEAVRKRHQERLDAMKWSYADCTRKDKDGNTKPAMINPKENSPQWTLVPAKSVPKSSFLEYMTPKVPRATGKRKGGLEVIPDDMTIAHNVGPGIKRIISVRVDDVIKMEVHGGVANIIEYVTPECAAGASGYAPNAVVESTEPHADSLDHADDDEDDASRV